MWGNRFPSSQVNMSRYRRLTKQRVRKRHPLLFPCPRISLMGDSIAYADRGCERLRGKYLRLTLNSRKSANVTKTAVARELACFLWGMINGRIA